MEIKKILVTGSEGYIGSVLVPKLIEKNYIVVGIDTLFFGGSILQKNDLHYKLLKQDIRQVSNLDLQGFDAIIHLAALSNDPMGALDKDLTTDINYKASITLAKKAKASGVKKFIFSSSCSIYGTATKDVVDENTKPLPLTAYAKSKIKTEKALQKLADDSFHVSLLRNSTVYGYAPHFRDDLVVNNMALAAYTTGIIKVLSDGTPWRPLIDVRDLADIFIAFLEDARKLPAEPINIGFVENNVQVKNIVEVIHHALPKAKVQFLNQTAGDKRSYKVDFSYFSNLFPHIKQQWTLKKSITDLILEFKTKKINKTMLENKRFTRLAELQKLRDDKKLDNLLYWNS